MDKEYVSKLDHDLVFRRDIILESLEKGIQFGTKEFFVYNQIRWYETNGKFGFCVAGYERLGEDVGMSEEEVRRALKGLQEAGLIMHIWCDKLVYRNKTKLWVSVVRLAEVCTNVDAIKVLKKGGKNVQMLGKTGPGRPETGPGRPVLDQKKVEKGLDKLPYNSYNSNNVTNCNNSNNSNNSNVVNNSNNSNTLSNNISFSISSNNSNNSNVVNNCNSSMAGTLDARSSVRKEARKTVNSCSTVSPLVNDILSLEEFVKTVLVETGLKGTTAQIVEATPSAKKALKAGMPEEDILKAAKNIKKYKKEGDGKLKPSVRSAFQSTSFWAEYYGDEKGGNGFRFNF